MDQANHQSDCHVWQIHNFQALNKATAARLRCLGLHTGKKFSEIRRYPFHGPVIIECDHQRIGIRYKVFDLLTGGKADE